MAVCLTLLAWTAISRAHLNKENIKMINKSTPILHVKNVEPSLKFWTERFDFRPTVQVPEGDHIGFVALENGSVELMLQTYEACRAIRIIRWRRPWTKVRALSLWKCRTSTRSSSL